MPRVKTLRSARRAELEHALEEARAKSSKLQTELEEFDDNTLKISRRKISRGVQMADPEMTPKLADAITDAIIRKINGYCSTRRQEPSALCHLLERHCDEVDPTINPPERPGLQCVLEIPLSRNESFNEFLIDTLVSNSCFDFATFAHDEKEGMSAKFYTSSN